MCFLMPHSYKQSRATLPQGPKIQTPHHKYWLARGRILSLISPIAARKPKKAASGLYGPLFKKIWTRTHSPFEVFVFRSFVVQHPLDFAKHDGMRGLLLLSLHLLPSHFLLDLRWRHHKVEKRVSTVTPTWKKQRHSLCRVRLRESGSSSQVLRFHLWEVSLAFPVLADKENQLMNRMLDLVISIVFMTNYFTAYTWALFQKAIASLPASSPERRSPKVINVSVALKTIGKIGLQPF